MLREVNVPAGGQLGFKVESDCVGRHSMAVGQND